MKQERASGSFKLRRKVDEGHDLKLIRTRRGEGYTLTASEADADD
ncbi:MAG TPA: helix-turn-helix domain-containing protein [Pyrinomonadaceae bacterium]|nr:helix-turn-helix domain-containing protein [Pyrinomonadaceae bacterium]